MSKPQVDTSLCWASPCFQHWFVGKGPNKEGQTKLARDAVYVIVRPCEALQFAYDGDRA